MKNEVRIKPLLKYVVEYVDDMGKVVEAFTGDGYEVRDGRTVFHRTGNTVREYQVPLIRIEVTPVDDDEIIPA